ncbi:MAG: anaerobic ribonucleoside-triphosphate reductase activating protein [Clostridiales bacterium]|nr:anaerobic ribonucleoside-triphosphate reductase activating protein [Clostridiales bacterium]
MYYSGIKAFSTENGPGVRVSLFVSGCRNRCRGCFQPDTWDFCHGEEFTDETERELLEALRPSYISGLTLLGGDPFEPENQEGLISFVRKVRQTYPGKTIWAFTGYLLETDLAAGGKKFTQYTEELLSLIDVLVDGPFIEEQKNLMLSFRGSENQRIILLEETRRTGKPVLSPLMAEGMPAPVILE